MINDDYTDDDIKMFLLSKKISLVLIIIISAFLLIYWSYNCYKKHLSNNISRRHRYTASIITDEEITMDFPTTTTTAMNAIHYEVVSTNPKEESEANIATSNSFEISVK